jgi:transposase
MPKLTLNDCVYLCMRDNGWWTFWKLQQKIKDKTGVFYGEPSISAAIRDLRKEPQRKKYNLANFGEVVEKRKIFNSKGFEYKLIGEKNGR